MPYGHKPPRGRERSSHHGPSHDHIYRAGERARGMVPDIPIAYTRYECVGVQRIFLELEDKPKTAAGYARKYSGLVKEISDSLRRKGVKPEEDERFINEVYGEVSRRFKMRYGETGFGFISESIDTKKWDCDNMAFLIFDVGRELGVGVAIVDVPNHVLLRTKNFAFETTSWRYYPTGELMHRHPRAYMVTPDDAKILSISYNSRGLFRFKQGNFGGAAADFKEAIAINPGYSTAYNNLGLALSSLGDRGGALDCYEKAIRLDPKNAQELNNLGNYYLEAGDYETAIGKLRKASSLEPSNPFVHRNLGSAYYFMGDYSSAIAHLRESVRLNPKDAMAHSSLGLAHQKTENFEEAAEHLKKAARLSPNAENYFNLGLMHSKNGDYRKAIEAYKKSIEFERGNPRPYVTKGFAHMQLEEYDDAIACFKEGMKRGLRTAEVHINTAVSQAEKREYSDALRSLRAALRIDPKCEVALENLAEIYARIGKTKDASDVRRELERIRRERGGS